MTEAEWLANTDFRVMLRHLRRRKRRAPTERKWRLFACACCRLDMMLMKDVESRCKVEVAEQYADGMSSEEDLRAAQGTRGYAAAHNCAEEDMRYYSEFVATDIVGYAENWAEYQADPGDKTAAKQIAGETSRRAIALLAHDIFGNPFRDVPLESVWLTPSVSSLAAAAYEERALPRGELDLNRLAVLADAVEEAGCTDAEILGHLRGTGPHVRGCWVVDLLLGRR
jgi:hypothetical protein